MGTPTLRTANGLIVRDRNKNGRLDAYEDPTRPLDERVEDVLAQMTLEEKAGMLFHTGVGMHEDGSLLEGGGPMNLPPTTDLISPRLIYRFHPRSNPTLDRKYE